jgi:hypothetical protein
MAIMTCRPATRRFASASGSTGPSPSRSLAQHMATHSYASGREPLLQRANPSWTSRRGAANLLVPNVASILSARW